MTALARQLLINPADPTARYIAFSDGHIKALGTALPIDQAPWQDAVSAQKAPTWYNSSSLPLRRVQIIDWGTPSGYTLDQWGFVYPWGGVDPCPGASSPFTTAADYFYGGNGGRALVDYGFVWDFEMNPAGDGTGYFLSMDGDVHGFGTGVASITHSAFLASEPIAVALVMDWSSKRYWVGDTKGRIWGKNGGNDRKVEAVGPGTVLPAGDGTYDASALTWIYGRDCAGLVLYDVTANAEGWMLDTRGRVWGVGGADPATGFKPTLTSPIWSGLAIIDDGSGSDPLRLAAVNRSGTLQEWVSSTAPTVTVSEPADPTNDTTRPYVGWTFSDDQGDGQQSWEIKVFDSATVAGMGFDPDTSTPYWSMSGTGTRTRVQIDIDIANDSAYRAYVRATDTSGLTSDWAYVEWEQDVSAPAVPTVTATSLDGLDGISLALNVNPSGLDPDALLVVQFTDTPSDDDSWRIVAGGYGLTPDGSGDATVVDLEAAFGVERSYRAQTYLYDPDTGVWTGSGWGTTDAATLGPRDVWALTTRDLAGLASSDHFDVQPDITKTTPTVAAVFWPDSRPDPIVVDDGEERLPALAVSLWALDNDTRITLEEIVGSKAVMLLRSPFGDAWYCKSVGDEAWPLLPAAPLATENTTIRDSHELKLKLQTVARPTAGPDDGPLTET